MRPGGVYPGLLLREQPGTGSMCADVTTGTVWGGPGLREQGDNFPQFDTDGPGFETVEWASKQHPPHLESWANWSSLAT